MSPGLVERLLILKDWHEAQRVEAVVARGGFFAAKVRMHREAVLTIEAAIGAIEDEGTIDVCDEHY